MNCIRCNEIIIGTPYFDEDKQPYCVECYYDLREADASHDDEPMEDARKEIHNE